MEGARKLATPTDQQEAVRLLKGTWIPLQAAMQQLVQSCCEASRSNSLAVLADTRQWPEDAAGMMTACGEQLIALMEQRFLDGIRQIPRREPPPASSALPLAGTKLELVSDERIEEDLAAASLVQRMHPHTQEQAQALAARLTKVFPRAYITETDVPVAAGFVARALLDALRDPALEMMTSKVRVMILGAFGPIWIEAVKGPSHQINAELEQQGWLPAFSLQHVAEWRSHLAALRSGGAVLASRPGVAEATLAARTEAAPKPVADVVRPSAPAVPVPAPSASLVQAPAVPAPPQWLPAAAEQACDWPQALDHSGFNAYAVTFFAVEQAGAPASGAGLAQLMQPLQAGPDQPMLGLRPDAARFAEAMLVQMQRLASGRDASQLIDTPRVLQRQASRNGLEGLPTALVQRLVAAQEMIRSLISDDCFSSRAKKSIIRFQIPWTRFLIGESRALLTPTDPFMALIWRVAGICRRSGDGETDELLALVDGTYRHFESAELVDATLVQRATDYLDAQWRELAERANTAIGRAVATWREEAIAREHLESLKRLVRLWLRSRPVASSTAGLIEQALLPALQDLSLRMTFSTEDKDAFTHGKRVAKDYLRLVTATDRELQPLPGWMPVYDALAVLLDDTAGAADLLAQDRQAFERRIDALAAGAAALAETTRVPAEQVAAPELREEPAGPPVSESHLARARELGLGTWVLFRQDETRWRGRIASRIAFQDKVIFVNRSGEKMAELTHQVFAQHLESGVMSVIDDNTSFSRALESMIVAIRSERDRRA